MAKTRKSEDKDLKSTQDVLKQWNDYYIMNDFGLGIQCDKCKKWRVVSQYQDSSEVPEVWICSMWKIDATHRGSCRLSSKFNENDFEAALYSPGSLVWAKLGGYPWWPGMIEDCPDTQHYFQPYIDSEHEYHILFFGKKPLRSWIKVSHIKDFNKPPPMTTKAKKSKDLQMSIEQANEAQKMHAKERLKNYSFALRYKGRWAKVKELDKVKLPPNCLKRRQKEKSTDFRSQVITEQPQVNPDSHQTQRARRRRKVKSISVADSKIKSVDDEELQPIVSRKKKTEKDSSSRNQAVLKKTGDKVKRQSSGKCVQQLVEPVKKHINRNQLSDLGKAKTKKVQKSSEKYAKHSNEPETNNSSSQRFAGSGKARANKKQPSAEKCVQHLVDPEINNSSLKQLAVLSKVGAVENEQSSGKYAQHLVEPETQYVIINRCLVRQRLAEDLVPFHEESNKNSAASETQQPIVAVENNKSQVNQIGSFGEILDLTLKADKDNEREEPEKEENMEHSGKKISVHNGTTMSSDNEEGEHHVFTEDSEKEDMEPSDEEDSSVHIDISMSSDSHDFEEHNFYTKDTEKEDMEPIEKEDALVPNDITMVSDNEDRASPELKVYEDSVNEKCQIMFCRANTKSLSGNDTVKNFPNESSDLVIHYEQSNASSDKDAVTEQEKVSNFLENVPSSSHKNAAEYLENDSNSFILDTDVSLLRTPYPSSYTSKNELFSNPCERSKKCLELTDELIESNSSRCMPYSFHRKRMKK